MCFGISDKIFIKLKIKGIYWFYLTTLICCIVCISVSSCTPDRKRGDLSRSDSTGTYSETDSLPTADEAAIISETNNVNDTITEDFLEIFDSEAFIRTIVQEKNINKEQVIEAKFRFYTKIDIKNISLTIWPDFKDFEVKEVALDSVRPMRKETFKNQKYNIIDLRIVKLKPKKAGTLTIGPATMNVSFYAPSGKKEKTAIGEVPVVKEIKKTLKSETITINVIEK